MILLRASKSLTSDGLRISTEQKYLVKAITEMLYVSEMERERVARVYQLFAFKCHRNTSVLRNSMIVRSTLMTLSMIAVIESRLFLGKNRLICRNKKAVRFWRFEARAVSLFEMLTAFLVVSGIAVVILIALCAKADDRKKEKKEKKEKRKDSESSPRGVFDDRLEEISENMAFHVIAKSNKARRKEREAQKKAAPEPAPEPDPGSYYSSYESS